MRKVFFILSLVLMLQGCSPYKGSFDCKPGKGMGCTTVSEVNGMVDKGVYNNTSKGSKKGKKFSVIDFTNTKLKELPVDYVRTDEKIVKIWMAPFTSKDDDYFDEQVVYKIIKKPEWVKVEG